MFHYKFRRKHFTKTTELTLARFILSIALGAVDTIWALYMNSFGLSDSNIGFISAFLVIISLLAASYSSAVLEIFREYKVLMFSLIGYIIIYFFMGVTSNLYLFLFLALILTIIGVLRMNSFDILFRDESKKADLNKNEAFMYAFINVGWLIGPLIAGYIMIIFGIRAVFFSSIIFIIMTLFMLYYMKLKIHKKTITKIDNNLKENFSNYFKNKKLLIPYFMSAGIEIWWALIYIFVPLFIINSGHSENIVGIFLSAVVFPLVLLEFKIGTIVEKYSFRKFFVIGFFFLGVSAFIAFFSTDIILTLFLLVIASFFMAFIEPIQDSYFFRQVKSNEEEKYYPIYGTATDIGSVIGRLSIALILLFFAQNFSFLIIGILMFILSFIALRIKD